MRLPRWTWSIPVAWLTAWPIRLTGRWRSTTSLPAFSGSPTRRLPETTVRSPRARSSRLLLSLPKRVLNSIRPWRSETLRFRRWLSRRTIISKTRTEASRSIRPSLSARITGLRSLLRTLPSVARPSMWRRASPPIITISTFMKRRISKARATWRSSSRWSPRWTPWSELIRPISSSPLSARRARRARSSRTSLRKRIMWSSGSASSLRRMWFWLRRIFSGRNSLRRRLPNSMRLMPLGSVRGPWRVRPRWSLPSRSPSPSLSPRRSPIPTLRLPDGPSRLIATGSPQLPLSTRKPVISWSRAIRRSELPETAPFAMSLFAVTRM